MPNGFGFNWPKHPSTKEYAVLSTVPIGKGPVGLLDSTEQAVRKLATAAGVKIPAQLAPAKQGSSNGGFLHSRALIVLATIAGLALLVVLRVALRRKSP